MKGISAHLLDVNFLIALAWPNHIAHGQAVSWFRENSKIPFATCPITEAGFIRISMNPLVVTESTTARGAINMLAEYCSIFSHVFWPDDLSITEALRDYPIISGHRQVTDAYLLALALAHSGSLVSFDGGIVSLAPKIYKENLIVVDY